MEITEDDVATMETVFKVEETSSLTVVVPEQLTSDYSTFVWPCARVLAAYIYSRRSSPLLKGGAGNEGVVVEIGAGTSLPGVTALKLGAPIVVLTDLSSALSNCFRTARRNGFPAEEFTPRRPYGDDPTGCEVLTAGCYVAPLRWGHLDTMHLSLKGCRLILASDCLYESRVFEDVIVSIAFLLQGSRPDAECWMTYHRRSMNHNIDRLLTMWNLKKRVVEFAHSRGDVELFVITNQLSS